MKKVLIFLMFVMFVYVVKAQQALEHKYKTYRSEAGKLYVQKTLPVYVYISTEPDKKGEMLQLPSDSTPKFTNPMYLDTEGYNSFRSPSAVDPKTRITHYPLTDVVFEVYADSRSPRTHLNLNAAKKHFDGKTLFIGNNISATLSSYDDHSGLEQILVSIDSSGYKKYSDSLSFTKEKVYSIDYYAVDNVGNAEKAKHTSFSVDLTAPVSVLEFDGDKFESNVSGRTKFIISASDAISGIKLTYYSIDDKAFKKYIGPIHSAYYAEGEHTIKYYSIDNVGNKEVQKEYSFYIDKTPPILVDEIMGNSFVANGREFSSGRTKLKLTAVDNKAGIKEIKYSINNGPYQLYDKPFYLTTVSGSLAVLSYVEDNVGNRSSATEKSTKSKASYVDLTGPQLKFAFEGKVFKARDTIYINNQTKISLSAADNESGLKALSYSIGDGAETPYVESFVIENEGTHQLNIYGFDNVDNSNRKTIDLVVDNTGPDIYSRFSILPINKKEINGQQADIYSSQVVLFLSATDSRVAIDRIYYSLDGGKEQMYTGIIAGFKRGKDYAVEIKAYDKLGNVNTSKVVFATDNTGPQIFDRFSVHPISSEEIDGKIIDTYPAHVSLFLSVTNAHVAYEKIYYSINGGKENIYSGIIDGFKPGSHVKMKVRALDRIGNETNKEIIFNIE
ncbi:MAG: hypothetical protein JEZ09_09025 [Salinivirgaceae bacterium]|nr:hypothetical protein [Salinivirgaceae bacterium]